MSQMAYSIISKVKEVLQTALKEVENLERQLAETEPKALGEIELTAEALNSLPWKPYQTGKGAWIFSNLDNPAVATLRNLLEKAGGRLELHGFIYRFSGSDRRFIARRPKA